MRILVGQENKFNAIETELRWDIRTWNPQILVDCSGKKYIPQKINPPSSPNHGNVYWEVSCTTFYAVTGNKHQIDKIFIIFCLVEQNLKACPLVRARSVANDLKALIPTNFLTDHRVQVYYLTIQTPATTRNAMSEYRLTPIKFAAVG